MEWFSRLERGYWKKKENQKLFLENFALSLGIKSPKDWGKVTTSQVIERGGHPMLDEYGGSLVKALIQLYPGERIPFIFESYITKIFDGKENGL